MIQYFDPSKSVGPTGTKFRRWQVYGIIQLPTTDPDLAAFLFAWRFTFFQNYGAGFPTNNISGTGISSTGIPYNLTGGGGRNSFRNAVAAAITTNTATLGILTVTNNVTLGYGVLIPSQPTTTYFRFLIEGTCNVNIPNPIITYTQLNSTTFEPLGYNNNTWSIQYFTQ